MVLNGSVYFSLRESFISFLNFDDIFSQKKGNEFDILTVHNFPYQSMLIFDNFVLNSSPNNIFSSPLWKDDYKHAGSESTLNPLYIIHKLTNL